MQSSHAVVHTFLPSYATTRAKAKTKTDHQVLFCVMIDQNMCFGMLIIQQKLLISSLLKSFLMEMKRLVLLSTFVSSTPIASNDGLNCVRVGPVTYSDV